MTVAWAILIGCSVIAASWTFIAVLLFVAMRRQSRTPGLHEMIPPPGAIQLTPEQRAQYEKEVERVVEEARKRRDKRIQQRSERGGLPPFENTRPPRHTIQQQR